jgi:hypothetical protein
VNSSFVGRLLYTLLFSAGLYPMVNFSKFAVTDPNKPTQQHIRCVVRTPKRKLNMVRVCLCGTISLARIRLEAGGSRLLL